MDAWAAIHMCRLLGFIHFMPKLNVSRENVWSFPQPWFNQLGLLGILCSFVEFYRLCNFLWLV